MEELILFLVGIIDVCVRGRKVVCMYALRPVGRIPIHLEVRWVIVRPPQRVTGGEAPGVVW